MLRRIVLAVLVLISILCSLAFECEDGLGSLATPGTYVLTEPSSTSGGLFTRSDVGNLSIDLKKDGTFYLRFPEVAYMGGWTVTGSQIELQIQMWGTTMVLTGTIGGTTISLDDGSVWTR